MPEVREVTWHNQEVPKYPVADLMLPSCSDGLWVELREVLLNRESMQIIGHPGLARAETTREDWYAAVLQHHC